MATQRKVKTKPKGFATTLSESINSISKQIEIDAALLLQKHKNNSALVKSESLISPDNGRSCSLCRAYLNNAMDSVIIHTSQHGVPFTNVISEFGIEDKITILEALEAATA